MKTDKLDILAVDFDGTLCVDMYPEIGEPKQDIISYCIAKRHLGTKLILWTCRSGRYLTDAILWCKEHGLEFDAVNENLPEVRAGFDNDCRKVFANHYLDDRNLYLPKWLW